MIVVAYADLGILTGGPPTGARPFGVGPNSDLEAEKMLAYELGHRIRLGGSWELDTALPPHRWSVRACQCSFCRLHGALSTSDPKGRVRFVLEQPDLLLRYRFGTHSADFLVCRGCGVYVGASMEEPDGAWAIVNARTLDGVSAALLPEAQPMSYEGESDEARRARRRARWSPLQP